MRRIVLCISVIVVCSCFVQAPLCHADDNSQKVEQKQGITKGLMKQIIERKYFSNTLWQWGICFLIICTMVIVRFVICFVAYKRLEAWVEGKKTDEEILILKRIKGPLAWIIIFSGLLLAFKVLTLPAKPFDIAKFTGVFFSTLVWMSLAWMCIRFVDILTIYLKRKAEKTDSKLDDQLAPLISKTLKIFVWVVAFAIIAQNLGYSLSGLLAGLGIGGLAFALAAKDTLANIFGSVTIFLDNPFQVGDWIKAGNFEGTVEAIGFRSTRIRTFYKTQICIPNNKFANLEIDNFSRMQMRRISTTLGFTYDTTSAKMEEAIAAIKKILGDHPGVYKNFFLVNFTGFGNSSLDVMLYYFTNTTDWAKYLDVRQDINLRIMKAMEEIGVEFAFQTMSLYLRDEKPSVLK